jgi:hypothetical protein
MAGKATTKIGLSNCSYSAQYLRQHSRFTVKIECYFSQVIKSMESSNPVSRYTSVKAGCLKWTIGIVVVFLLGFAAYMAFVLSWAYSDGERAGYLQKFSRKGWLCKSYEGELAMTTVPGVAPLLWNFTVRDEAVAKQMNALLGKRIALSYEEHLGIPTNCFGETSYFVNQVRVLER